jgi:ferritin-like metal-binding protein YciE
VLWSALQSLKATAELEQTLEQIAEANHNPLTAEKYGQHVQNTHRRIELLEEALRLTSREDTGE